jgi:competence protein ComEC
VIAYGWLVGADPSVRRAVAAAVLYLLLSLAGLRPRAIHILSAVAAALALADPLVVLDVGAWLSFGATLGIVLCASRFVAWARPPASVGHPAVARLTPRSWPGQAIEGLWTATLALFSATLAAELILLPISAAVFSRVSAFGLVLNFIAIPAMAVVQIAGFIMVGLSGWCDHGARLAASVSDAAAGLLVGSSTVVDSAPWLSWRVPPVSLWWTLAFYTAYGAFLSGRGRGVSRMIAFAAAGISLAVIVTAPTVELNAPRGGALRVTMIDVGQGDAILVQFPAGQSLLIDAGGARGAADFGARVVTPALWALGVRRLDWLALTHGDIDHAGGAIDVAHDFRPREIWEGVPVPNNPELRALRIDAHAHQIVWRQVLAGHIVEVGSVRVEVLHPPPPDWERQRIRNDDSLVIRVDFGDVEMLLTGDAGREFETLHREDASSAPLRLLKIGHHGSRTSSSDAFVRSFRPDVAFVSAGRGNVFGHPAPDVLARFERLGAKVFRTDQDGAIVIETDGAAVSVRTMSGRTWRFVVRRE